MDRDESTRSSKQPHALATSPAFHAESLRSEVRRVYAVLGVIVLIFVLVIMGKSRHELDYHVRLAAGIALWGLLALQLSILAFARWAGRHDRTIPTWFVVTTVVIESLMPTGIMVSNILPHALPPYVSLSSPPILAYGLLISLTTLRLRPMLCVLAGAIGAASYAVLLLYVTYGMHIVQPTTGLPRVAYVNISLFILISGLAAAWVAHEIRRHVEAALGEAETRRQMDRIEQDLSVARSIQRALLPAEPPDIAGYDIAGWNRPADQTGGDYFDWQTLPDGNWIVTLADVSGHGIGPALVTAACRAYVRASGLVHGDLASLASRINRLLADDLRDGRFVTMASVLIDPRGGPLALLSAGHAPIVLYLNSAGAVQDILPHDLPLAIEPEMTFGPAQPITMAKGDVLALVTDGFTEWARLDANGQREDFGLPRLRESLRRHAQLPASQMISAITADVAAFAQQTPQQDDLTMVIIRRVE
jgi:serine phosphatase RsbU (regulator of sigma subunit)